MERTIEDQLKDLQRDLQEVRELVADITNRVVHEIQLTWGIAAKDMLTREEAAAYMGVTVSGMNKYCSEKVISYSKSAGKSYFKKSDLLAFMQSTEVKSNEQVQAEAAARLREKNLRRIEPKSFNPKTN